MGRKNSDCDVRLMRRLKRRRLDIENFEIPDNIFKNFLRNNPISDEKIDADYKEFLLGLGDSDAWREPLTSGNTSGNSDDNEFDEEDDADPNYKSFLDNLKVDGKFYALQVVIDDRPLLLKYHDGFSDDELEFPSARTLRKVPEKEQVDYKRKFRSNVSEYMMEIEANVLNKDKREIQRSTTNVLSKDKKEIRKNVTNILSKGKTEIQKSVTNVLSKDKREIQKGWMDVPSKGLHGSPKKMDTFTQKGPNGLGKQHDGHFQKPTPHGNYPFMTECNYGQEFEIREPHGPVCANGSKHEIQGAKIDPCYKYFLEHLDTKGDCSVFLANDGTRVPYEEHDDDSSSDSDEVLVATNASDLNKVGPDHFETSRPSGLLEADGQHCRVDASRSDCSEFRKKLIEKLRKPYDQVEYDRLWETLNDRQFKSRHIDLRGKASAKTFTTDEPRESYLEQHSTLGSKIDAVKSNRHKVLNLMRGFFFWLEHVAHQDNFQPWRDALCLAVMPGSR